MAHHNDRNRLGRILSRLDHRVPSCCHDDINLETHQLCRKLRIPINFSSVYRYSVAMFCPSMWPSSRRASRIPSARVDSRVASSCDRYPIRGTFFGCCAVATASATKSTKAITESPTNFRLWILDFRLSDQQKAKRIRDVLRICFSL